MSIKKQCNQCAEKNKLKHMFVYKGICYCKNCLHQLILDLADDGAIGLYTGDKENKGIIIRK